MFNTRWEPRGVFAEVNRLRDEVDRLFGNGTQRRLSMVAYPPVNMWEDDNALYVEAELPGFELNDLEIVVTGDNQLSVKGERKLPELQNGSWHRKERGYGTFSRVLELPERVDADKVTAEFKNGVLVISLPKREEVKPRRIEIKSN